jgi:hypothetical protein
LNLSWFVPRHFIANMPPPASSLSSQLSDVPGMVQQVIEYAKPLCLSPDKTGTPPFFDARRFDVMVFVKHEVSKQATIYTVKSARQALVHIIVNWA